MIGDIYTLTLKGTVQGQRCENVLHYEVTADADYSQLAGGLNNYAAAIILPAIANIQTSEFLWDEVTAQKIWPLPAFFPITFATGIPGDVPPPTMPAEVAFVVSKQTILAGRKYRGRLYVAGIGALAMSASTGKWDTTTMGAASSIGATLLANVPSTGGIGSLRPVIYHRVTNTTTVLAAILPRDVPRAQRRRQIGRGI